MDLKWALKHDPNSTEVKNLLALAEKQNSVFKKKQQNMYSAMFNQDIYDKAPEVVKEKGDYSDPENPRVFFDIKIGESEPERIEFELYANAAPKTAENFRCLCTGEKGSTDSGLKLHYKGNKFHRYFFKS